MLSLKAFDTLNTLADGAATVHTLHRGEVSRGVSDRSADELLLNALMELAESGFIQWTFESDYGNAPAQASAAVAAVDMLVDWQRAFGHAGPRGDTPDPRTLEVWVTEAGLIEVNRSSYAPYLPFLREWHGWSG